MINLKFGFKLYDLIFLLLIFIFIFLIRLPYADEPALNIDDSFYLYIAKDIIDGGVPYKTSFDHKGPVMFFLLVPVIFIFGNSIFAVRIFTTLYLILSLFFVYLIGKKIFNNKFALLPPLIYGLFFNISFYEGLSSNGEIFMMLPVIMAIYLSLFCVSSGKSGFINLFSAGALTVIAVLIKASAFFSLTIIPLYIIFSGFKFNKAALKEKLIKLLFFSSGIFLILIMFLIYFLYTNSLNDFIFSFFTVNSEYIKYIPVSEGIKNFYLFMIDSVIADFITMPAVLCFILLFFLKSDGIEFKKCKIIILLLTFFSFVGVYWGRVMYGHYYLQMGLSYSLIIILCFYQVIVIVRIEKIKEIIIKYIPLLIFILIMFNLFLNVKLFKSMFSRNITDSEIYKVSSYIKEKTVKNDRIFILGGEPVIYFLTDRKAGIKYFGWIHHSSRFFPVLHKTKYDPFPLEKPKYIIYENGYQDIEPFYDLILKEYKAENQIGNSVIFVKK